MDLALIRKEYRFIRDDSDDIDAATKRYEENLFREFVICDLSRYKEKLLGLRWRTAAEVKAGKGVKVCGSKRCDERNGLLTLEVPFAYREGGESKQALVKAVLCELHADQLKFTKSETEQKSKKKEKRKKKKKKKDKKDKKKRKVDHSCSQSE